MKISIITFLIPVILCFGCNSAGGNNKSQESDPSVSMIVDVTIPEAESLHVDETDGYLFTPFGKACREGNLSLVKELVQKEGVEADAMMDEIFAYGGLLVAIRYGQMDVVEYLVRAGADVNRISSEGGWTALTEACVLEDREKGVRIASLLLEAGADPDGVGDLGFDSITYPLFIATERNNFPLVQLLTERGASVMVRDKQGETVLSLDCDEEIREYLTEMYQEEMTLHMYGK